MGGDSEGTLTVSKYSWNCGAVAGGMGCNQWLGQVG